MMKRMVWAVLIAAPVALGGCVKDAAVRAGGLLGSGTVRTLVGAANSDDPAAVLQQAIQARGEQYTRDPRLLVQDIRRVKHDFDRLMGLLRGEAGKKWGGDTRVPDRVRYVKYTQNYNSRAVVDFDRGRITVETVEENRPDSALKNAIVTTLLTPDDPRSVDLFSDKEVTLSSDREPYLRNLVNDHKGRPVQTPAQAEAYAAHLVANRLQQRSVALKEGKRKASYVTIDMVSNFSSKQAEKYRDSVEKFAARYRISPSLVYAIIRTESNFNPFAVSSAPAYGLMQLVPTSGGRDAYRKVTGEDGIPSREHLFDANNNIELGVAYLSVLTGEHLKAVQNDVAREYCVISAYNTGAGNVLKTFSGDRVAAVNAINGLEPPAVYERLRLGLPYEETRRYLHKVVNYRRDFVSLGN